MGQQKVGAESRKWAFIFWALILVAGLGPILFSILSEVPLPSKSELVGSLSAPPSKSGGKGSVLPEPALAAVDIAIVMYIQQSAFVPIRLSPDAETRISRYAKGARYRFSAKGVLQRAAGGGTTILIPSGGELLCRYSGAMHYTVRITQGEVGVLGGDVFIKEGTKLELDMVPYVFTQGEWKSV